MVVGAAIPKKSQNEALAVGPGGDRTVRALREGWELRMHFVNTVTWVSGKLENTLYKLVDFLRF